MTMAKPDDGRASRRASGPWYGPVAWQGRRAVRGATARAGRPGEPALGPVRGRVAVRLGRRRRALRAGRLVPGPTEPDRGERDADLAEDLDRDEEAGEQEQDAEELAELEPLGHPEPVERVAERRHERADRDQDRRRDAAVELPGEQRPDRARQRRDEVDRRSRPGAMSRLNRNSSPGWFGSSE